MVDEFHVALTDPEAEPMQKVWDGSTQSQRIRSMVCAIPPINPKWFGGCVDKSTRAFLKGVGETKTFWEEGVCLA